jgi:hypothetical protein
MSSPITVVHRRAESRFEATLDGHRGVLHYQRNDAPAPGLRIPSVVVDPAIEGRGVAGALTRAALDWARASGLRVEPLCPYVAAWMRRHPDYDDLRD